MNKISVGQLNNYIKSIFFSEEMLHNIAVVGEIDGLSARSSGVWFSLKDKDASVPCVCWDNTRMKDIKNGDLVTVCGTVDYWNKVGKINFTVHVVTKSGVGDLLEEFKKLFDKLQREGLFERKRMLPARVCSVGVVTSKFGAVIRDIISVARRRNPNVNIILYPAAVQGANAEKEILYGLEYFANAKNVDVIIIARGGGAAEDLSAFNLESVVRKAAASPIPVVSAIGHETDFTLTDYAADLRAPTPSAAAELCVPEFVPQKNTAIRIYQQMRYVIMNIFDTVKYKVNSFMNLFPRDFVAVSKNGRIIKSAENIKSGDKLQICFIDGKLEVVVK
jgi:exodeoxyribonuclease VII large subunit